MNIKIEKKDFSQLPGINSANSYHSSINRRIRNLSQGLITRVKDKEESPIDNYKKDFYQLLIRYSFCNNF